MKSRVVVDLLRVLLAGALVVILLLQLVVLPWLSEVMAEDLPGEAHMRWPILILAILGLSCVQAGIVCTLRLLGLAYPFKRSSRCAGWSSCRSALSGVHGWTPGMVPHRFGLRGATEHSWLPAEPGAPAGRTTLASLRPALLLLNG